MESLNRYGYDRYLQVDGQDGRALFENTWLAVNRPFTLGIQNQRPSLPQSEGTCTHGRNQVGVRIDHYGSQRARQSQHESFAEYLARAYGKNFLEHFGRQYAGQYERIEVALVIRRENIRTALR